MSQELRAQAEKRLKDRRQFWASSFALVAIFAALVVVWGMTTGWHGYFWPGWAAIGFAFAIVFHALNVYGPLGRPVGKDAIDREVRRMGGNPEAGD